MKQGGFSVSKSVAIIGTKDLIGSDRYKRGIIKCRLIHMDGLSVVQPDVLLSKDYRQFFFVPKFFCANQIGFFAILHTRAWSRYRRKPPLTERARSVSGWTVS